MAGNNQVGFDLSSLCNAQLNRDFNDLYQELILSMKKGDKASISIKIDFERPANMDQLVNVGYSINGKKPDRKVAGYARITQQGEQVVLITDEPVIHVDNNITLFDNKKAK